MLVSLIMAAFLVSSCTTQLSYNLAGWWIGWKVRGYVSLNEDQRTQLKLDIKSLHDWHRQTQLPRYADFLDSLAGQLEQGELTAEQVRTKAIEIQELFHSSLAEIKTPVLQLLNSLSATQAIELLEELDENLDEFYKKRIEPDTETLKEERLEGAIKSFQSFTGKLSKSQKLMIAQWNEEFQPTAEMTLAQRRTRNRQLQDALGHTGLTRLDKLEQLISTVLFAPEKHLKDGEVEVHRHNQQLTFALIANINNSLSSKQKERRTAEIQKLAHGMRRLIQ